MSLHGRLWCSLLLIAGGAVLGVAPSAKADEVYSFSSPASTWSFQVPALITTNTTGITKFLSFTFPPGSPFVTSFHCTKEESVNLTNVGGIFNVTTFVGGCEAIDGTALSGFPGEGTIGLGEAASLTITSAPSDATEPTALLLLGGGLASLLGLRRRASRKNVAYREHGKRAIPLA